MSTDRIAFEHVTTRERFVCRRNDIERAAEDHGAPYIWREGDIVELYESPYALATWRSVST